MNEERFAESMEGYEMAQRAWKAWIGMGGAVVALVVVFGIRSMPLHGQAPATAQPATQPAQQAGQPTGQFPGLVPQGGLPQGNANAGEAAVAATATHPLEPALEIARKGLANIKSTIKDYSCTVVKR